MENLTNADEKFNKKRAILEGTKVFVKSPMSLISQAKLSRLRNATSNGIQKAEKMKIFTTQMIKTKVKHNMTIKAKVNAKVKAKVTIRQKIIPLRGLCIYPRFMDHSKKKSLFLMMNS